MNELPVSDERRSSKRVRQACEPCRRKKTRCPGEKPACAQCVRLGQQCTYTEDPYLAERSANLERRMNARLAEMESRLEGVLRSSRGPEPGHTPHGRSPSSNGANDIPALYAASSEDYSASKNLPSLPSGETHESLVLMFMKYCNGQPLPLFHPDLANDFHTRDHELLGTIISLSIRFSSSEIETEKQAKADEFAAFSRDQVTHRINNGSIRLSTIQSLVLLSFLDFTNGDLQRSCLHLQSAKTLAGIADLADSDPAAHGAVVPEERRRCVWCIWSFEQTLNPLDCRRRFGSSDYTGPSLSSPGVATGGKLITHTVYEGPGSSSGLENGILAFQPRLQNVWRMAAMFIEDTKDNKITGAIWKNDSEYAKVISSLLEHESGFPFEHRFDRTRPSKYTKESVRDNRPYWSAWLSTQIVYHTILTLINHPLPVSAWLRPGERFPRTFSQATTDLVMLHSSWISRLVEIMEEVRFEITDPFLGYCISIAATVFLHFCYAESASVRDKAEASLAKSMNVLRSMSARWPIMSQIVALIQRLEKIDGDQRAREPAMSNDTSRDDLVWQILLFSASKHMSSSAQTILCSSLAQNHQDTSLYRRQTRYAGTNTDSAQSPAVQSGLTYTSTIQDGLNSVSAFPLARSMTAEESFQPDFNDLLPMTDLFGASPSRAFDEWWSHGPL